MKNKKGFTLVELLSVIVILAVLAVIASSSVIKLTKNGKDSLFCTKLTIIESAAKDYGALHELELNNSTTYYQEYKSIKIKIGDLIDNGIEADKNGIVLNPIDNSSMNDMEVIIYLKNNNIYAYIDNNIC